MRINVLDENDLKKKQLSVGMKIFIVLVTLVVCAILFQYQYIIGGF